MFFDYEKTTETKIENEEISQNKCEEMYGMGSDYPLNEEECSYEYLAYEIVEMQDPEINRLKKEKTKEYSNQKEYESRIKDLKDSAKELSHRFTRNGGYIEQIKNYLNIDFDKFDDSNIKNKREKIKIIYLLYTLKPQRSKEGDSSDNDFVNITLHNFLKKI